MGGLYTKRDYEKARVMAEIINKINRENAQKECKRCIADENGLERCSYCGRKKKTK